MMMTYPSEVIMTRQCRWKKHHPEKNRAHNTVYRALKSGIIQREDCAVCGDPETEAHHEDYSKPLDVIWLCSSCHKQVHSGGVK